MAQFLTPLGGFLSDEGNFEALLPVGGFVAEEVGGGGGAVAFNLEQLTFLSDFLGIDGDLSLLPASFDFGLPEWNLNQAFSPLGEGVTMQSTFGVQGQLGFTVEPPQIASIAQYLTPFGGILTKEEVDEFQLLFIRGAFVDSKFAFEFAVVPGTNRLLPFGGIFESDDDDYTEVLLPVEGSILDRGALTEVYVRRSEQYLSPFGSILEKVDGENFQALLTREGFADNNYEFDEPVVSYEFAASDVIALHWTLATIGEVTHDAAGPGFEVEGPLAISTMVATLGISGSIETTVQPFDVEGIALDIAPLGAAFAIIGDLQYGIPTDIPLNFNQVGAFTVRGALVVSGEPEFTPGPDIPHDLVQVGAVALTGVLKVLGQLQSATSFDLLTQPILIDGVLGAAADFEHPFPSIINLLQLGEIVMVGTLTFGATTFRFDSFTEGLPNGWYVDGPILETVPNPNYGTAYGNAFFRRWTWKGYDPAGTMVAASGSEQDCFAQTLAVCQARHEDWRELAR